MTTKISKALFNKSDLIDVLYDDSDILSLVEITYIGQSRWASDHDLVFKENSTDRFFKTQYRKALTEYQDQQPFYGDGDTVECFEVQPVETIIWKYVPVNSAGD